MARCPMCNRKIEKRYSIFLHRRKHSIGWDYCSYDCAFADAWGPKFRKARIRYLGTVKKGVA